MQRAGIALPVLLWSDGGKGEVIKRELAPPIAQHAEELVVGIPNSAVDVDKENADDIRFGQPAVGLAPPQGAKQTRLQPAPLLHLPLSKFNLFQRQWLAAISLVHGGLRIGGPRPPQLLLQTFDHIFEPRCVFLIETRQGAVGFQYGARLRFSLGAAGERIELLRPVLFL